MAYCSRGAHSYLLVCSVDVSVVSAGMRVRVLVAYPVMMIGAYSVYYRYLIGDPLPVMYGDPSEYSHYFVPYLYSIHCN